MKTKILTTSLLLSLGLSAASAGQPDPRFDGIWVGVETYQVYTHGGRYANTWGGAPVQKPAVIGIADSGKAFAVEEGMTPGRYEISPSWGKNTLSFHVGKVWLPRHTGPTSHFGRTYCKLVLSADGNTLTETGLGVLPGLVTCNISGTFHRREKK